MAGILRQSFKNVASKALQNCTKISTVGVQNVKISSYLATRGLTLNTASRTLHSIATSTQLANISHRTQLCSCRQFQTKGDENLAEFLAQEINHEKDNPPPKSTKLSGWTVTSEGPFVKINKIFKDERITVDFDVSSGLDDMDQMYEGEGESEEPRGIVSRPPFNIEIKKTTGKCLELTCDFNPPEPQFEGEESNLDQKDIEDQYSITEVALTDAENPVKGYTLSGANMDEVMYDLLMEMLDERGIDDEFVTNMVKLSTSQEQKLYVDFLQDLKEFVSSK